MSIINSLEISDRFAERFTQLREERKLSTNDISRKLGIGQATVWRYGKNEIKPNFYNLLKLAEIFGVSLDYLVGRTDNPNVNK
jgi:transcriptional regulator with XRE-family HTH domain